MLLNVFKSDIHWIIFYILVIFSWISVALMATDDVDISSFQSVYGAEFWLELCQQPNGFDDWLSLFLMWTIMSGAMMMPTLIPALRTYQDLIFGGSGSPGGFVVIIFGFLIVWIGYCALTSTVQATFLHLNILSNEGIFIYPIMSSTLLAFAGLYQFSHLKNSCASKCRAPLTFFMQYWELGLLGSLKMGLRLGLSCLGCCWVLMLLTFVGGTMSLAFMGVSTIIMIFEKLPQIGDYLTRPLGYVLLILAGFNLSFYF
jgi:predicted metal-binding membrane protein